MGSRLRVGDQRGGEPEGLLAMLSENLRLLEDGCQVLSLGECLNGTACCQGNTLQSRKWNTAVFDNTYLGNTSAPGTILC